AERLLDGTGWLPQPLRTPGTEPANTTEGNTAEDTEALPAFLADDEESTGDEEPDEPAVIAAE
ncbi:MAG: DNA-binding protein, partial [Stellaceae bacterium]